MNRPTKGMLEEELIKLRTKLADRQRQGADSGETIRFLLDSARTLSDAAAVLIDMRPADRQG